MGRAGEQSARLHLKGLRQALTKIDRPGSFCVSGAVRLSHPGLEVKGMGPIGLPLSPAQAKELKERCQQAPYGKGESTLVDKSVRQVWHLEPGAFALINPEWSGVLAEILQKVQEELGLEKERLESHLYDLLLYERGSFFAPHRDGERLDRMVATLVITLPSAFKGGELIVRHDGQAREIAFSEGGNPLYRIHYAAFYADCEHELRPLKDGYRLCLIYNLTLAKAGKRVTAPRQSEQVGAVHGLLRKWTRDASARKLVVTLDHQYTERGLSWDTLKGADRGKARVLCEAAESAGCKAYLAVVTLHESGSAEYAADRRSSYRRRRSYYDESDDASDYEMGEVFDSSLLAEHIHDRDGLGLPIDSLSIDDEELLEPQALKTVKPEEEFEGYTGNAGMTLDRWYRHAAVLIWPERLHFDILCERPEQARAVVPLLTVMVTALRRADAAAAGGLKAQCLLFASAIISGWPHHHRNVPADHPGAAGLLDALVTLGERPLIERFIDEVLTKDDLAAPGKWLVAACQEHGWQTFKRRLVSVCRGRSPGALERNAGLVEEICTAKPKKREGYIELCRAIAQEVILTLRSQDEEKSSNEWLFRSIDRGRLLATLARAFIAADLPELLEQVAAHALMHPKKYPLVTAHLSALEELQPWLRKNLKAPFPSLSSWVDACRETLEALTAQRPEEPTDFRRPAAATCKCRHCNALNQFLSDPRESIHGFREVQQIRSHLEHQIRADACDVLCKTERRGSPHLLICTKTQASYERALEEYHANLKRLANARTFITSPINSDVP